MTDAPTLRPTDAQTTPLAPADHTITHAPTRTPLTAEPTAARNTFAPTATEATAGLPDSPATHAPAKRPTLIPTTSTDAAPTCTASAPCITIKLAADQAGMTDADKNTLREEVARDVAARTNVPEADIKVTLGSASSDVTVSFITAVQPTASTLGEVATSMVADNPEYSAGAVRTATTGTDNPDAGTAAATRTRTKAQTHMACLSQQCNTKHGTIFLSAGSLLKQFVFRM